MKKKTYQTKKVLADALEKLPEEVGAMLVITSDRDRGCCFMAGIDQMGMSKDCLNLVSVMHELMNGQLRIANAILGKLKDEDRFSCECGETCKEVMDDDEYEDDDEDEDEDDSPEDSKERVLESVKDILHDLVNRVFNDDDSEEDD